MSTKITLSHNSRFSLFANLCEEGLVFLRLKDPIMLKADFWEASCSTVTIALDSESMEQLCEDYLKRKSLLERE